MDRQIQRTVIVSEAYSAANLGDLELVERSIEVAKAKHAKSRIICLAVDPRSFVDAGLEVELVERLFPRLRYLEAARTRRVVIALQWIISILLLTAAVLLPARARRPVVRALSQSGIASKHARPYADADHVIAVGGGYLGDQYLKETVLTLWTWWWASRLGNHVETMPISVEIRGAALSRILRMLGQDVTWRARDTASLEILRNQQLNATFVPDLAFFNLREDGTSERSGTVVALVGADYLSDIDRRRVVETIAAGFASRLLPLPVRVLSMHAPMGRTAVGADARIAEAFRDALREVDIESSELAARTYEEVCSHCDKAEVVLSARMHAGIAGLCRGAKVALLAYEHKHVALFEDAGLEEFVIDIRRVEAYRSLFTAVRSATRNRFTDAAESHFEQLSKALGSSQRGSVPL